MERLTTKDIARRAGCSQTTVSRVLNGHPYVSEALRARVLEAVRETGYQPNDVARSMVLQKTGVLGLIVSDITNPFYGEISRSIVERAKEQGYSVFLCNSNSDPELQAFYLRLLRQKRVDGIICASVARRDPLVEELVRGGFPCMTCNRRLDDPAAGYVASDNVRGAGLATRHLIRLGHRRIGFVSGPMRFSTAAERHQGYREALAAHGIAGDPAWIVDGGFRRDGVQAATRTLLGLADPPTALVAANDLTALAALECIEASGRKVPGDMAVVGYDDISLASHARIRLTTVAQRKEEMGRIAVDALLERIAAGEEGIPPRQVLLEPRLIVRDTCGSRQASGGGGPDPAGKGGGR